MRQIESVKKKDENFFDILLYIRWKWDNVIFGCNYIFQIERRRYHSFMRARGGDNYLLQIEIVSSKFYDDRIILLNNFAIVRNLSFVQNNLLYLSLCKA